MGSQVKAARSGTRDNWKAHTARSSMTADTVSCDHGHSLAPALAGHAWIGGMGLALLVRAAQQPNCGLCMHARGQPVSIWVRSRMKWLACLAGLQGLRVQSRLMVVSHQLGQNVALQLRSTWGNVSSTLRRRARTLSTLTSCLLGTLSNGLQMPCVLLLLPLNNNFHRHDHCVRGWADGADLTAYLGVGSLGQIPRLSMLSGHDRLIGGTCAAESRASPSATRLLA